MRRTCLSLTCAVLLASLAAHPQSSTVREKGILLKRIIELNHYSPRAVDDSFSVSVFKTVMNEADPRRLLFTATEYLQLSAYRTELDDELHGKSWDFFDSFSRLYKNSLQRADSIINKVLQKPLDFSVNESLTGSREESFNFVADNAALANRWSRYLKFTILDRIYDAVNADSTKKISFKEGLVSLEPAIREKVKQAELRSLKKILDYPGGYAALVTGIYLNGIASCFDPHTTYFSPREKEAFQGHLSTESYSFGLELGENKKEQIVIERLTPGGPAWKSGELNKGDELLSLQWEGKEAVEMTASTTRDAYEMLNESAHDRLVFKFRKADGTIKVVLLRKEKIDNEENIVKGFVLKGEKKIGYILLPGFYTEWENETGSSCANDVAKEIVKLKKEKIDGLILDVRFNGGGSLEEAIEMIGIFIDEGPLAADKGRDGKQATFRDPNRGTIYDGPMALMVNGQSASASEMLAASLQDYNRAVIIGSNTFGKATMQQILVLDTTRKMPYTGAGDKDAVKITIRKLYRLNGRSAQWNGVTPDIPLPDAFDGLDYREKFQKYSLPADTARRNNYYKPLPLLPVSELSTRSAERIGGSDAFRDVKKIIEVQRKTTQPLTRTIPLKWDSFEKWMQQQELELQWLKNDEAITNTFTVENHGQDKQLLQNDSYAKEINESWLQNLGRDIYIQESFLALIDLIHLQKQTTKN